MLTWALIFMFVKLKDGNGLHLMIAMGCDVAIFYWIAQAFIGGR